MKPLVVLIFVLLLLFDLAQDGALGQAKCVAPPAPVKSLVTSHPHPFGAGSLDIPAKPPPAKGTAISPHSPTDYATQATPHPRKLIHFCYLTSFGGLPR